MQSTSSNAPGPANPEEAPPPVEVSSIATSRFGMLAVLPDKIVHFPYGMVGFSAFRDYLLLDHAPGSPFHWLQSIDRGDLAFPVASPDVFIDGYDLAIPADLCDLLQGADPADLWLGVVVTFPTGGAATLNLRAPIVLNTRSRLGVQMILEDPHIPMRFEIGERE